MFAAHEIAHPIVRVKQIAVDLRRDRCARSETRTGPADRRRARRRTRPRDTWRSKSMLSRSSRGGVPVFSRPHSKPERLQRFRELARRRLAGPSGRTLLRADVNQAVQERSGRDDERAAAVRVALLHARARRSRPCSTSRSGRPCPISHSMFGSALERASHPLRRRSSCRPARAATRPPARGCD